MKSFLVVLALLVFGTIASTVENNKWKCGNGKTIPPTKRCDGDSDCGDGTDEQNCTTIRCLDSSFDVSKWVPVSKLCNGVKDCADGTDEVICFDKKSPSRCGATGFSCANGKCIEQRFQCDTYRDCDDGSDEVGCQSAGVPRAARYPSLDSEYFQCPNSYKTIPNALVCDKIADCEDASDEVNCNSRWGRVQRVPSQGASGAIPPPTTPPPPRPPQRPQYDSQRYYSCPNSYTVIPISLRCDGLPDCPDGSDEKGCPGARVEERYFQCRNGERIFDRMRCNGINDCFDGSDEDICYRPRVEVIPVLAQKEPEPRIQIEIIQQLPPSPQQPCSSVCCDSQTAPFVMPAAVPCNCPNGLICEVKAVTTYCPQDPQPPAPVALPIQTAQSYPSIQMQPPVAPTAPRLYTCPNSFAKISVSRICDGFVDCPDGSDENRCTP